MSDNTQPFTPGGAPAARAAVEQLKAYSAPLEGRRQMLRLDFNENTIGPSPLVAQALRNFSTEEIAVYPEYDGLRDALLQNLEETGCRPGLKPDQVGLFNGVDAAIHAVFQAYGDAGETLLTTAPTFGYYSPCAGMQGMTIEAIPYEGETFDFPLAAIQEALAARAPRLLLICNPNNPTGTRLPADQVIALAASAPGTLVVVDELYEAFTGDSVLPSADFTATPNLLVFRSLAKTAGLAGLRIGFAIGHADVVAGESRHGALRRQQRGRGRGLCRLGGSVVCGCLRGRGAAGSRLDPAGAAGRGGSASLRWRQLSADLAPAPGGGGGCGVARGGNPGAFDGRQAPD